MCWNGKNPQKAPQHHSSRKPQPIYKQDKYMQKYKNIYTEIQ